MVALRVAATLLSLGMSLAARTALADDATDPARSEARRLAGEGDEAFAAGRCDLAIPLWRQADAAFHAPTIVVRIARCQALLGKVVDARSTLESMLVEPAPAGTPDAFADIRRSAEVDLQSVRARIATLVIAVEGPGVAGERRVEVDGHPTSDLTLSLDPGKHRVTIRQGSATWEDAVRLGDGESRTLSVAFRSSPGAVSTTSQRLVGIILGGAGIITMAVGAGLGVAAVEDSHNLLGPCGQDRQHCPPSAQPAIDRVSSEALASDLTLGGGAALFIAGAVVVLTAPPPRREAPHIEVVPWSVSSVLGAAVQGRF